MTFFRPAACAALLALFVLVLLATPARAQTGSLAGAPSDAPTIGLALGGGGAKGFAHIGLLQVLQEKGVPVDVVAGTSMGAVVGGLYASGYSPAQIDSIARGQDWTAIFSDASERRLQPLERRVQEGRFVATIPLGEEGGVQLPSGLIAGQRVSQLLGRLLLPVAGVRDFTALPVPFGAVATDVETGEGVLLTGGYLPRAIRASMAIPSVFTPTEIEGRTFIDGGVARNVPASDARRLGAGVVVCSDVGDPLLPADSLSTFVDVMMQAMWYRADASTQAQLEEECDVTVRPDISGLTTFSFERAGEIIERGRAAALAASDQLDSLARVAGGRARPWRAGMDAAREEEAVRVASVRVEGAAPLVARRVRGALGLGALPAHLSATELDAAIDRVYSTGLFSNVTYRLEPGDGDAGGNALVVRTEARVQERLGIGLRYDSPYKAALLFSAQLRDRLGFGAQTELSLRLGEALQLRGRYNVPVSLQPRLGVALEGEATRAPIDLFSASGERTASARAEVLSGSAQLGAVFGDMAAIVGTRVEGYSIEQEVGGEDDLFSDPRGLTLGEALLYYDTFDRAAFASRGVQALLQSTATPGEFLSSRAFSQHVFDAEARVPLLRGFTSRLTAVGRLTPGRSFVASSGALPQHYRLRLGGATAYGIFPERQFALLGYDVQQLAGRSVQALGLGAQVEVAPDLFALLRWNAGRASRGWDWTPRFADDFEHGFGATLGAATLFGPVKATVMGEDLGGPYDLQLSVGYTF